MVSVERHLTRRGYSGWARDSCRLTEEKSLEFLAVPPCIPQPVHVPGYHVHCSLAAAPDGEWMFRIPFFLKTSVFLLLCLEEQFPIRTREIFMSSHLFFYFFFQAACGSFSHQELGNGGAVVDWHGPAMLHNTQPDGITFGKFAAKQTLLLLSVCLKIGDVLWNPTNCLLQGCCLF